MSQNPTDEYAKLLQKYHDLAAGVRVIRRAAERAFRTGALPPVERIGVTPVEECEAIARAIYAAAGRRQSSIKIPAAGSAWCRANRRPE